MDLNDQLRQLRELAKKFVDNLGPEGNYDPVDPDDVYVFAQKFQELDEVLKDPYAPFPNDWDIDPTELK